PTACQAGSSSASCRPLQSPSSFLLLFLLNLIEHRALFVVQHSCIEQLGPPFERSPQCRPLPPEAHLFVMSREKHVWHLLAGELRRPRVVGVIEEPPRKRAFLP